MFNYHTLTTTLRHNKEVTLYRNKHQALGKLQVALGRLLQAVIGRPQEAQEAQEALGVLVVIHGKTHSSV